MRVYQGLAKKKGSIFLAILQPHTQLHIHNTTIMTIWQGSSIFYCKENPIQNEGKYKNYPARQTAPKGSLMLQSHPNPPYTWHEPWMWWCERKKPFVCFLIWLKAHMNHERVFYSPHCTVGLKLALRFWWVCFRYCMIHVKLFRSHILLAFRQAMQKDLRPNFILFYGQRRYHICTIFLFDEMSLQFQNLSCINLNSWDMKWHHKI